MASKRKTISLAGEWRFALDPENIGIRERWFGKTLAEAIALPGTTDEAKKGEFADECCTDRLSRIWRWIGPAWYQKTVTIPKGWKDKRIVLFLERTKDSQVWVDRTWVGSDDSLSTPHEFDLTQKLSPGEHTITVLIDNAKLPPVGPCHQVDERTQTNWNGILGQIELRAMDKVCLENLHVYPESEWVLLPGTETTEDRRALRIRGSIRNSGRAVGSALVTVKVNIPGHAGEKVAASQRFRVKLKGAETSVDLYVPVAPDLPVWDEFERNMLSVTVSLSASAGSKRFRDSCSVCFGLRRFETARGQFVINGRPTFLRGKNDCALFPLTGYAPMDKAYWLRHLGVAAEWGLNHFRFHSWCPPRAAFEAADELGIYFQVELPNKRGITAPDNADYTPPAEAYETLDELRGDAGDPAVRTAYLTREGERILKAYGNHPSFVMMTLGNEIGGDEPVMEGMCDHFRSIDGRHLYAMGTNAWHWEVRHRKGNEFWVIKGTKPGKHVRGASWEARCHIDHQPPSTMVEYSDRLLGVPVPVVGHEMAQFEVFPDFREIKKYTGVLKAKCFEIFRERLRDAGMLDQAMDFFKASGAVSTICHREDVEAALRTPGFGGFQMLDLQDFSGQGVALVGLLDVFMHSKGLIKPKAWRQFCCETVPLLLMRKYTWTSDEQFRARIQVAHYGPKDLQTQKVCWEVKGRSFVTRGASCPAEMPTGAVTEVDFFSVDLSRIRSPEKLTVSLRMPGTRYRNSYEIWVYPAKVTAKAPRGVLVARTITPAVVSALDKGRRVIVLAKPDKIKKSVAMAFQSGFWSPMFRNKPGRLSPLGEETPGTQGILTDPKHPVFDVFPTEFHTNWQWWHLVKNSRAMVIDDTPKDYRPTIQVIDGFDRNHKLGLLCEGRVGNGKILVCSIDLLALQDHPEARQLLSSIYSYASGKRFNPAHELEIGTLKALF